MCRLFFPAFVVKCEKGEIALSLLGPLFRAFPSANKCWPPNLRPWSTTPRQSGPAGRVAGRLSRANRRSGLVGGRSEGRGGHIKEGRFS